MPFVSLLWAPWNCVKHDMKASMKHCMKAKNLLMAELMECVALFVVD